MAPEENDSEARQHDQNERQCDVGHSQWPHTSSFRAHNKCAFHDETATADVIIAGGGTKTSSEKCQFSSITECCIHNH